MGEEFILTDVILNFLSEEVYRIFYKKGGSFSIYNMVRVLYTSKGLNRKERKFFFFRVFSSKKGKCNWCKISGYFERECRKKVVGEFRKVILSELYVTSIKSVVLVFSVYIIMRKNKLWYLDSGVSDYVIYDRRVFDVFLLYEEY